ncbi:MAG: (2Fe-2S)-binding protein [Deltaproteobacteria bacterium]|nr:(2Fe-2S)-binding protein [Deltaproteobacteria bacterium]
MPPRAACRLDAPVNRPAERRVPIRFRFEGETLSGYADEPLAVSLLGAGVDIMSRSMKFHRPRGAFCLSGCCGNCLMRVDGVSNVFACKTAARDGMSVFREPGFPSADHDLLRVFDVAFPKKLDYHHMFTGNPAINRLFTGATRWFSGARRIAGKKLRTTSRPSAIWSRTSW